MRNLSKLVFQRVVAVSVGILLQIGFLIVMATYLRADFFWIRITMNVLSWAMVIYIISCGVNPSYKIAWIVLILAFPVAGLTIYLLFGGNKISSYEHRKMQSIEAVTMQQLQQEEEPLWELAAARTPAFNHARYLLSASGYPIYDDADATYFPSGESCYAAMLEELQKAEHYIFIEFFIIAQGKMWDPILQLLREKAAAGVDVRVVYDDFGCITRLPMQYAKKLREMGIRAHAFNPYVPILSARLNNRDRIYQRARALRPLEGLRHSRPRQGRVVDDGDVPVALGLCRPLRGGCEPLPRRLRREAGRHGLPAAVRRQSARQ